MATASGDLGFELFGLKLAGGDKLGEADRDEEEYEDELESLLPLPKFSTLIAESALLEPDPVPIDPRGE